MRREKLSNNIFISGIPASYIINNVEVEDKKEIIKEILKRIDPLVTDTKYKVEKVIDPGANRTRNTIDPGTIRTRYSARLSFNDSDSRKTILKNAKLLGNCEENDSIRKVFVRCEDPPLTRKENRRLSDKLKKLKAELEPGDEETKIKLSKGKLYRNQTVIDEFNLSNQIFC